MDELWKLLQLVTLIIILPLHIHSCEKVGLSNWVGPAKTVFTDAQNVDQWDIDHANEEGAPICIIPDSSYQRYNTVISWTFVVLIIFCPLYRWLALMLLLVFGFHAFKK